MAGDGETKRRKRERETDKTKKLIKRGGGETDRQTEVLFIAHVKSTQCTRNFFLLKNGRGQVVITSNSNEVRNQLNFPVNFTSQ